MNCHRGSACCLLIRLAALPVGAASALDTFQSVSDLSHAVVLPVPACPVTATMRAASLQHVATASACFGSNSISIICSLQGLALQQERPVH
jgi:hypothetical protein